MVKVSLHMFSFIPIGLLDWTYNLQKSTSVGERDISAGSTIVNIEHVPLTDNS